MFQREGWQHNSKKIYRIYKPMEPQLRNRTLKQSVKARLSEDREEVSQASAKSGPWTLSSISWQ
jgi:hypothetical protein